MLIVPFLISFVTGAYLSRYVKNKQLLLLFSVVASLFLFYTAIGIDILSLILQPNAIFSYGFWALCLGVTTMGMWFASLGCIVKNEIEYWRRR
jgi:hypothetical protein